MIGLASEGNNGLWLAESLFELGGPPLKGRSRSKTSSSQGTSHPRRHYVRKLKWYVLIKELPAIIMDIPSRNAVHKFVDKRDVLRAI